MDFVRLQLIEKDKYSVILKGQEKWLGLEVVFRKLRSNFQRNGLTRTAKLMMKRKERYN